MRESYDVAVIGAGHAGCEASLASARMGARTILITPDPQRPAVMPCNPSVGGIGKSHLVFELDALGGEIGKNADYTGIQFRTLNTKKGPAVRACRAQCDKEAYSGRMAEVLKSTAGLTVYAGIVSQLIVEQQVMRGVVLEDGRRIEAKAVVLTAGTFLSGRILIGSHEEDGGRRGEKCSVALTKALGDLGFQIGRLKTGTPPRLRVGSVDKAEMEEQPGDEPPPLFSWQARRDKELFHVEHSPTPLRPWAPGSGQIPCYMTHTTALTHEIIRSNLCRSSLYGGMIEGAGVRYCPSVEDKIVKFPDKESHHVFVEPEGRTSPLLYPNGISNSLPEEVQRELVHSIPGLGSAEIVQPGYAIEYAYLDPTQLWPSLETKLIEGLYFAGQVNGTTGYEEAAAQGFIAGVNAARKAGGKEPIFIRRTEGYIGVMVDDLVTKGTEEPYRMFTSRAEHRLLFRQDNARFRMKSLAGELGIVDREFLEESEAIEHEVREELDRLSVTRESGVIGLTLLRRPEMKYSDLQCGSPTLSAVAREQVEIEAKYAGYVERELAKVREAEKLSKVIIPQDFDYQHVAAISHEAREKLSRVRPHDLGQAARVPGVRAADVSVLSIWVKRHRRGGRNTT